MLVLHSSLGSIYLVQDGTKPLSATSLANPMAVNRRLYLQITSLCADAGPQCASHLYTLTAAGAQNRGVTKTVLQRGPLTLMHLLPRLQLPLWSITHIGWLSFCCSKAYDGSVEMPTTPTPSPFLLLTSGTNIEKEEKKIEEEESLMVCCQHWLTETPCLKFVCLYLSQMHSPSFAYKELLHFHFPSVVELRRWKILNKRKTNT